jgi:exopolysaccharide production protein ExoQ
VGAQLAFLICGIGIAGLFFLDRDKSVRNSAALWLPVIWLWIAGSRSPSSWFMSGPSSGDILASTLEGNPYDAAIYEALIVAGLVVLFLRKKKTNTLLKASAPILVYFLYCLLSTAWSPFHEASFKRWIKAVGDLIMVLIVMTDAHPVAALRRLYSRVGFILFPLSVVLIRYTDLGRAYDADGTPTNTGVTTNKNTLGLILFVISLGVLWNIRALLMDKKAPNRARRLVAQCTLMAFGVALLQMAHSATSIFCFALGGGLLLASSLRGIRTRPSRVHALCVGILIVGALTLLFGGGSAVTSTMGRSSDFSGRVEIWRAAIASADSPLLGTGFESFWNANAHKVALLLSYYWNISNLNSAHNGYLQIYLDLGGVGLCLLLIILISGYFRAAKAFQVDREVGCLMLAYIVTCAFYSITEAGFRILTPSWIFLLVAVVSSTAVAMGRFGFEKPKARVSRGRKELTANADEPIPEDQMFPAVQRSTNTF